MAEKKQDGRQTMPTETAKSQFLKHYGAGLHIDEALRRVGRVRATYNYWRKTDREFVNTVEFIRARRARAGITTPTGEFGDFCEKYLHQKAYWHQLQWADLLEGRAPRDLHPAETFTAGRRELCIVNTPPEHAKSTTITVNYCVYRICQDPNVRIIIVSKTRDMAQRFVYAIKNRLTHPRYRQLQMDFAPENGFAGNADQWSATQVYLGSQQRDSGEKDPTLLALGIGGQIYGARADLIILDDCVTLQNAHAYEDQIEWLSQEVITRLSDTGKLLIVGTRVASEDLYSELQRPERYPDLTSPWTYLAQPAVLEFTDTPETWVTLWPKTQDGDNEIPRWDGKALYKRRGIVSPRIWAMAYQQQQVLEDAVFTAEAVRGCVNGARWSGVIPKGMNGVRPQGMEGLYVVAGLDPAMVGHTGAVVLGVDREDRKRYIIDCWNQQAMTPAGIRDLIYTWTDRYGVNEWRIEKNAFQQMLTQDETVRTYLANRGALLKEHHTGSNKWDQAFGVASMAMLFDGWADKPRRNLIELPSTMQNEAVKALIEQLITWSPDTKGKTDLVMALWFAEIRARELTDSFGGKAWLDNPYATRRQREHRVVVNLEDYWQDRMAQRIHA